MLSERLRELEAAGLVERSVLPTSPPTVEYRLTARGRRLGPLIEAMRAYAEGQVSEGACGAWMGRPRRVRAGGMTSAGQVGAVRAG